MANISAWVWCAGCCCWELWSWRGTLIHQPTSAAHPSMSMCFQ